MSVVRLSPEIAEARRRVSGCRPETSVVGQGLPPPRNLECAERMSTAIRENGAVPAWIGVVDGSVVVGLSQDQLRTFAEPGRAAKVARRDLPFALAHGGLGATTVSSTIWAAHRAGIAVGATGGTGESIRTAATSGRPAASWRPGAGGSSGPKSIVGPVPTAEWLEELGVGVVGTMTGCRSLTRGADRLDQQVRDQRCIAPSARSRRWTRGGVLLYLSCSARRPRTWSRGGRRVRGGPVAGVGQDVAVHLSCLAERTGGASMDANLVLLEENARLAGLIAVAASAL
jgi:pseudouridine-5'-phosphate glycosidase